MEKKTIRIKNMCCQRCVEAVTDEFHKLNLKATSVKLGEAIFQVPKNFNPEQLDSAMKKRGFLVIKTERDALLEKIKISVYELIEHLSDNDKKNIPISTYLEDKIRLPYRHIAKEFKQQKGISIEQYIIRQKVERIKEHIENSNLQLTEIADLLGYKSLQHLSSQFRKITGMSMIKYRKSSQKTRIYIDKV